MSNEPSPACAGDAPAYVPATDQIPQPAKCPYARVIADSMSPDGHRLTTFEVGFHRFILPEVNTHRVLSRNYRSSRAVPSRKLIEEVAFNPAMPVHLGRNQPGMQATEEVWGNPRDRAVRIWRIAASNAAVHAEELRVLGVHKQVVNRLLEPFLWVYGVITATEWTNFFQLRRGEQAQPEFRLLADLMWEAREASTPVHLESGQWHLPYIDARVEAACMAHAAPGSSPGDVQEEIRKLSVSRAARVTYRPASPDGSYDPAPDLELHDRLAREGHWSPFEHVATPDHFGSRRAAWGNFRGWVQYRRLSAGGRSP